MGAPQIIPDLVGVLLRYGVYKRMENEEFVELIRSGKDTKSNMAMLYKLNRGFIWQQCIKYQGSHEMDDIMQEAYFVLDYAVRTYDPSRGSFISWLGCSIRYLMPRQLAKLNGVKIPIHMLERYNRLQYYREKYKQDHGREPSDQECMEYLEVTPKDMKKLTQIKKLFAKQSLSDPIGDITLEDTIADDTDPYTTIEDDIDSVTYSDLIHEVMDETLTDQQNNIIRLRMDGKTLVEVCDELGIKHKQQVQQAEQNGLKKIRNRLQQRGVLQMLYENAYHGTLASFNTTFTSATERIAVRIIEAEEA